MALALPRPSAGRFWRSPLADTPITGWIAKTPLRSSALRNTASEMILGASAASELPS
jgi:hypothetical protein